MTQLKALKQCKGAVVNRAISNLTIEELLRALVDKKITKYIAHRNLKRRVTDQKDRYVITIDEPNLLPVARIANWYFEPLDLFIPTP